MNILPKMTRRFYCASTTVFRWIMWLTFGGFLACGCDRYSHTNIYDPEVSGTKYEVIMSVGEMSAEQFDCGNSQRCFYVVPVIQNTGTVCSK